MYKKASLRAKDPRTGEEVPWDPNPDATWIDGSVDNDLPMTRLAEMFNVNHFIVSQVNPHVIPFLAKEEEIVAAEVQQDAACPPGPSLVTLSASLAKGELLHRLQQVADIGVLPTWVDKLRSVLSQRYSGDINIFPKISYADFPRVLSNPTPEYMIGCMLTGQRATWPKLSRIQNHVAIELALDNAIQNLRARAVFSTDQVDLRLSLSRPSFQWDDLSQRSRTKSAHKVTRFEVRTEPSSPVMIESAPTTPSASRPNPRVDIQPLTTPKETHMANVSKTRSADVNDAGSSTLETILSSNDTSDRDYFADPDSDTTDIISSPSPATSPTFQGPTLWPSTRQAMALPIPQPSTPAVTTATDWRAGALLNLTMTSAHPKTPSSPELRYKRMFHLPGPVTPDSYSHVDTRYAADDSMPLSTPQSESRSHSRSHSRRSSEQGAPILDQSGTRGMLLRKRSFQHLGPGGSPDQSRVRSPS